MNNLDKYKVIGLTHNSVGLENLGKFVLEKTTQSKILHKLKLSLNIKELLYLATCNRVEFIFTTSQANDEHFTQQFLHAVYSSLSEQEISQLCNQTLSISGKEAISHVFSIIGSIESLVVGEREILTQFRKAYEEAKQMALVGDSIRLLMEKAIIVAKEIFTTTYISKNKISVASLACEQLQTFTTNPDPAILIIGAGTTNQWIAKYLSKHTFSNITVYNRTLEKAQNLAAMLHGKARALKELEHHREKFDIIITCIGCSKPILDEGLYRKILKGDTSKKIILDLAVPGNVDPGTLQAHHIEYINIKALESRAAKNKQMRLQEIDKVMAIINTAILDFAHSVEEREVELAMTDVPKNIKSLKAKVINDVYADDIQSLSKESQELVSTILTYVEKKCITISMLKAKELLLKP